MKVTIRELLVGFSIGASIGIVLAAVITQFPYVEKIVTPYVLLLVTTPMIALVPLLMLNYGFGSTPRYIAVTLAVFPDGDDQFGYGFSAHRPGQDRAGQVLRRQHGADIHARSGFRWRCR